MYYFVSRYQILSCLGVGCSHYGGLIKAGSIKVPLGFTLKVKQAQLACLVHLMHLPGLSFRAESQGFSPRILRYIPRYFDIKPAC